MAARLVKRDVQIGYALGKLGPATAEDVQRLLFPASTEKEAQRRSTARRRLAKLCKEGLAVRLREHPFAGPNWYALTAAGREFVVREGQVDERELRVLTGLGRIHLPHHQMLTRLHVSVVLAARQHPTLELRSYLRERELRGEAQRGLWPVVPDSLVVLYDTSREAAFAAAIEGDLGRERFTAWREKVAGYRGLAARGPLLDVPAWGMAVVVPRATRARSLLRVLAHDHPGVPTVVGIDYLLNERNVLGEQWYLVGGERRVSLAQAIVGAAPKCRAVAAGAPPASEVIS